MMGFGGYGSGGSFLSPSLSNLSASAPPFTIDRSPNSGSVPLVDLLEPSYSGPMNSSLNNWLPSRAAISETNFFSNPNSELNSMPSPNNTYRFQGLQAAELSNSHTPHLSTIVSASADPFGYGQSADNVAKPYYPSYLSPTSRKDGPFVIPDQTSYDWSSTSRGAVSLDGSSTDYSQRSLDSKYGAQWGGGLWNGFTEWKQGKQGSFEGSFSSKETDGPVPSMYENYMNPEAHVPKGLNRGEESSHGVNILGREKHGGSLNVEKLDGKAFLVKTSNIVPLDYSRSILGSISELSETRLESPPLIFGSSSADHQLSYNASSEQHVKQRANDGVSFLKSSPALVVRAPAFGSSSSAPGSAPFKTVNSGSDASDKDLSSKAVSSVKDTHSQLICDHKRAFNSSQLHIHLERDDPISLGSLLTKNDETSNKESISNDTFHHISNAKSGHRIPNFSHDRFNLDLNKNETVNSVQDPSEGVDHYNHAVDSPCWKGVPGTHSSPFDASEIVPDSKKINMYNNFNVQAKQVCQLTTGDEEVSSQKPNENTTYHEIGYLEHDLELPLNKSPDANSVFRGQKSDDATEAGHHSETKGVQHPDDNHEYGSRSIGGPVIQNMKEAGQCIPSHLPNPVGSVEDASCTKLHNSNEGWSTPAIDVLGLVSTIHNLSELLLFHCTRGSYELKQKDLMAVQNVINNLSACISKNAEKMAPIQVPSSEKDNLDYLRELSKLHEDFTAERPQGTQTPGLIQALVDAQNFHERSKYYMSGKQDGMLDSLSVKTELDIADEDKATKSLKKVLTENFNEEEETQAQTLLYKNLWLEAEAALCTATYKARYNRMKVEMENCKLPKSKDVKQPLMSLLASNSNEAETLLPKVEDCPATKSQELSGLSTSIQDDNVMARFQILRCRNENSNSSSAAIVDKPSSSMVIPNSNNAAGALPEAHEEEGSPQPEIAIKASSISSTNKDINDFDASVMARFHILKSRADICNPPSTEVQPLVETYCNPPSTEVKPPVETYKPRFVSQRSNWPLIASISEYPEHGLQHHTPETTEGQLIESGFHMSVADDPLAQSHPANRVENSLHAGWYDRVPSDWEHVRKEDLGLHNR